MKIAGHDIGVCSWSLRIPQTQAMIEAVKELGLSHLQLAPAPLLLLEGERRATEINLLKSSGLMLASGMVNFAGEDYTSIDTIRRTGGVVPDEAWPMRSKIAYAAAPLAAELGMTMISMHLGFIPPVSEPSYRPLVARVADVARAYATHGVQLLFETGQEHAAELHRFLLDVAAGGGPNTAANFDPANMILYGSGDPIEAVHTLAGQIGQIHIKDAVPSAAPGRDWGREVAFGQGEVGVKRFLTALHDVGYAGPLIIEREADNQRMADVRAAIAALRQ